jgi:PPOX class probable F420-dependent enzyme
MSVLNATVRELVDGNRFATVATLNADGSPHTSLVWIEREDDVIVFSTTTSRRKARNLARDPRLSLTIVDAENPYRTVDIAGVADVIDDPDKTLPRKLAHKYLHEDPPEESPDVRRVIVRVTPRRVTTFSA